MICNQYANDTVAVEENVILRTGLLMSSELSVTIAGMCGTHTCARVRENIPEQQQLHVSRRNTAVRCILFQFLGMYVHFQVKNLGKEKSLYD